MTAAASAQNLAAYSLQVAAVVLTAALLVRLLRPRPSAASLAFWQALLALCLLLPLCQRWREAPPQAASESVAVLVTPSLQSSGPVRSEAPAASWPIANAVLWAVGLGVVARTAWFALGLWGLGRLRRGATAVPEVSLEPASTRIGTRAECYLSARTSTPITFGLRRPVILLPPSVLEMPAPQREAIVYHELLHVRRRDWAFTVLEEAARALLWFHPAVWWLIGRIHLTREQVVDEAVIRLTGSRERYVEALLGVARARAGRRLVPATLFLHRGLLKKRVAQIFAEANMSPRRLSSYLALSSGFVVLAVVSAVRLFPLQARAAEPPGAPVQVTSGAENALHQAPVEYPRRALERGVEGEVVLDVDYDEQGSVYDARVVSGPEPLRAAALQSVLHWHFGPPAPLPGSTRVSIRFELPRHGGAAQEAEARRDERAEIERVERVREELQTALADPAATDEQRADWKKRLFETNLRLERMRQQLMHGEAERAAQMVQTGQDLEKLRAAMHQLKQLAESEASQQQIQREMHAMRAKIEALREREVHVGLERAQRQMQELAKAAAEAQDPAQRAAYEAKLREIKLHVSKSGALHGPESAWEVLLTGIRTERMSAAARELLLSRLELREGEPIRMDEQTGRRIKEAVASVDEHFRVRIEHDKSGGITLVISAP